ncbi:MAG TPA: hypothetical protein VGH87_26040 [Polyangiaceae bacterium]
MRWVLALFVIASCDRFIHRSAPDAGESVVVPTATATTSATATSTSSVVALPTSSAFLGLHLDDDEEMPLTVDAGPCPLAIHPNYCRRRCKSFTERQYSLHARRISTPTRSGTGTCGSLKVFAEDDATGGIVEYYDDKNQLVGVADSRQKPCGTYGDVPSCKPDIKWGPPHNGTLRDIAK